MKQALVERMKNTDVDENYVTPTEAVTVLQAHILWLGCKRVIWEPCDPGGASNITKEFTRAGHTVIATGIPEVNFLQQRKAPKGTSCIITNPPYSLKDEFLNDTRIKYGAAGFEKARIFYKEAQGAEKVGVAGAAGVVKELQSRFKGQGKPNEKSADEGAQTEVSPESEIR